MPLYSPLKATPHYLNVGNGHTLYLEESGNPKGLPALFLHGGPGSGTKPEHRQYFNPKKYRIILFDQRGCGKSKAKDPLKANTTAHLIKDIEVLRAHLNIENWHVLFGSSWGSTLALAYAQAYPKKVKNLVLSAIFLADKDALDWFVYPGRAPNFFPNEYAALMKILGHPAPAKAFKALHAVLHGPAKTANAAAMAFSLYDYLTYDFIPNVPATLKFLKANPAATLKHAQLMVHYQAKNCFLTPNQLINNAAKIRHIPTTILHGQLDLCCPPINAHKLHAALPKSMLHIIPACGHRANEAMTEARVAALDSLTSKRT